MGVNALAGVSGTDKAAADRANSVVEGTFAAVGPGKPFACWGPFNIAAYGVLADALTTTAGSNAATVASGTGVAAGNAVKSANVPPGTTILTVVGTNVTLAFPPQFYYGTLSSGVALITEVGLPANLSTLIGATIVSPYFAGGTTITAADSVARTLTTSAAPSSVPVNTGQVQIEFRPTGNVITTTGADANATQTGAAVNHNSTLQLEKSYDGGSTWIVQSLSNAGSIAQWTAHTPLSFSMSEPEIGVLYRLNCPVFAAVSNVTINYRISGTGQASQSLSVP